MPPPAGVLTWHVAASLVLLSPMVLAHIVAELALCWVMETRVGRAAISLGGLAGVGFLLWLVIDGVR